MVAPTKKLAWPRSDTSLIAHERADTWRKASTKSS
jgi:hypothetical protein